jgi:hypothetical protein
LRTDILELCQISRADILILHLQDASLGRAAAGSELDVPGTVLNDLSRVNWASLLSSSEFVPAMAGSTICICITRGIAGETELSP